MCFTPVQQPAENADSKVNAGSAGAARGLETCVFGVAEASVPTTWFQKEPCLLVTDSGLSAIYFYSRGAQSGGTSPHGSSYWWVCFCLLPPCFFFVFQLMGFSFLFFKFLKTVSLCSPSWPGTHYLDQASLKLTENCQPLPPEC